MVRLAIFSPLQEVFNPFTCQQSAVPGVPAHEPAGPMGVVAEQKVVNRLLFPAYRPGLVGCGPCAEACVVCASALLPILRLQDLRKRWFETK